MKVEWSIKSIKHWEDGTWDAILYATQDGCKVYDRALSTDGFNWANKYKRKLPAPLQEELTQAMGDMLELGVRIVVF